MKKIVLKLDINDDKTKKKALKGVSSLLGIVSISMDMKEKKLTVVGNVDPVDVVGKVRKVWPSADIISVGSEEEVKKEEQPKQDGKKNQNEQMGYIHYYPITAPMYYYHPREDNPNGCVIC